MCDYVSVYILCVIDHRICLYCHLLQDILIPLLVYVNK